MILLAANMKHNEYHGITFERTTKASANHGVTFSTSVQSAIEPERA